MVDNMIPNSDWPENEWMAEQKTSYMFHEERPIMESTRNSAPSKYMMSLGYRSGSFSVALLSIVFNRDDNAATASSRVVLSSEMPLF